MSRSFNSLSELVEVVVPTEDYQEGLYTVINHSACLIKYGEVPTQELPKDCCKYIDINELVLIASIPEINFQFMNGNIVTTMTPKGKLSYFFKPRII